MTGLEVLARESAALAAGIAAAAVDSGEAEAARVLAICNACRYCEGYCAMFKAMTRRLDFARGDLHYLAHLCHSCGACLHACPYAPPHEFAVSAPRAMAGVRMKSHVDFAWPRAFGALYRRASATIALALAFGLALMLALVATLAGLPAGPTPPGNFYAVLSHGAMIAIFGAALAYAAVALGVSVARYRRFIGRAAGSSAAAGTAIRDALALEYLRGGHGEGCNDADDAFSLWRRRFHHATFYGFAACFAATCVAAVYHYALGLRVPYAWTSLPVLLGVAGGIALIVGPAGLLRLSLVRDANHQLPGWKPVDRGFIALLMLVSASGLTLLAFRATASMPALLIVHLAAVLALFATMPYGKFAHAVFRVAALLKWAAERRERRPVDSL